MTSLLGMFAKHWTPSRVKTRLAAAIGERQAAEVHRLFVQTLVYRFANEVDLRILAFDPPNSSADFQRAAGQSWELLPQGAGDLGQRMSGFFAAGLVRAERVVLIGSDSPDLPVSYVAEAFEALATHDVVLGPAADGGYYLVGAAGFVPPIFANIAWSTADVWAQTVQRLEQAHCRWHVLPQWYDVDTADDLIRLRLCLRQNRGTDAWLTNLADRLLALLANPLP